MQVPSLIHCSDTMLREETNGGYDGIHVFEIPRKDLYAGRNENKDLQLS